MQEKNKIFFNIFKIIITIFALIGFLFISVFFAMKFGLTKASSSVDSQSNYFKELQDKNSDPSQPSQREGETQNTNLNLEKIKLANQNWDKIKKVEEWENVKIGLIKDYSVIEKVSKETGISKRLLISPLVVEQLRLMTSQREVFKKYFQPLSILGSQTQFSLGIYGIKENTAKQIEINLKNKNSPYYLGKSFENILDYKIENSSSSVLLNSETGEVIIRKTNLPTSTKILIGNDAERIKRLTNEKDHYYSYLYAALYLKQILNQWKISGFDISDRPEILMTIYNLGFEKSFPKENPEVGGAIINLNNKDYTFGSIAFYFYYSDEMGDVFN